MLADIHRIPLLPRLLPYLLALLSPVMNASGQDSLYIDSLQRVVAGAPDAASKIETLIRLGGHYSNTDFPKALQYSQQALDLANREGPDSLRIQANLMMARQCFIMSDLDKAMEFAIKALELATSNRLELERAQSLDAIGMIYYDIGDHARSSENFFNSLRIYEKIDHKIGLGATFCRIGTLYLDQKDYDKARDYYQKSINLAREIGSDEGIASNLNNIGKVYTRKKMFPEALASFREALSINIREGNVYLTGYNYLNIAEVYVEMNDFPKAIASIDSAKTIFGKLGNKLRLAKCQNLLADIYLKTGQPALSRAASLQALRIALDNGYRDLIVSSASTLNRIYLSQHDSATAFRYFILEKQYRDSLFLDEKQKTLSRMELQYQFEQKDQEMKVARQRRNIAIAVISGCLVFSIVIIILILKQLRLKARKQELERENYRKELEFKNKELVLNVMSLMKKNEMLADLSEKLITIESEATSDDSRNTIKRVALELQKSQEEEIWKEFSVRFREVHGAFYEKLLQRFPNLTPNELKLCAFLRLNMSSKDIAELTGQRITTLETARYRLRQKLGIVNSEVSLVTFLSSL